MRSKYTSNREIEEHFDLLEEIRIEWVIYKRANPTILDDAAKQSISNSVAKLWKDPEYRARQMVSRNKLKTTWKTSEGHPLIGASAEEMAYHSKRCKESWENNPKRRAAVAFKPRMCCLSCRREIPIMAREYHVCCRHWDTMPSRQKRQWKNDQTTKTIPLF
jgi:hypothetical protein